MILTCNTFSGSICSCCEMIRELIPDRKGKIRLAFRACPGP